MSHLRSKIIEFPKKKEDYPKKDIEFLIAYHRTLRSGLVEEIFEDLLGEYQNISLKLERYGENSNFWKNDSFQYSKDSNAESKRPSAAWLRAKVKRYEHEANF